MKQLPKPSFGERAGYWVNPMFLPESLRAQLARQCLRGRLTADQSAAAVMIASEEAQSLIENRKTITPTATIQEELNTIAIRARGLLQALRTLEGGTVTTFAAHWDALAFGTAPEAEISDFGKGMRGVEGRFLGAVWDLVQDLETSARYASGKCRPSKQAQPSRLLARALTRRIAERLLGPLGRLPPYSRDTWFPRFMAELCYWPDLGLPCGAALVESAVRSVTYPD